jgi:hypothetical protein
MYYLNIGQRNTIDTVTIDITQIKLIYYHDRGNSMPRIKNSTREHVNDIPCSIFRDIFDSSTKETEAATV